MSFVRRVREVEFDAPSGEVLKDESISCASGVFFDCEKPDVLFLPIDRASSLPRPTSGDFHHSSILRTSISTLRLISVCITSFLSRFCGYAASYFLTNLNPILFGEVFPSLLLCFGHILARLFTVYKALEFGSYFISSSGRHRFTFLPFRSSFPLFFGKYIAFNPFSAIDRIGEQWIVWNTSIVSNPAAFRVLPCRFPDTLKDDEFRFLTLSQQATKPRVFMASILHLCGGQVHTETIRRLVGFTDIANITCSWVNEAIDKSGILILRLGSLLKQVAHRFTSRERGGAAPFIYYNSIMLEGA